MHTSDTLLVVPILPPSR